MTHKIIVIVAATLIAGVALCFAQTEEAQPTLSVEAKLCTKIENLMPVGTATDFTADVGKVYLWCKVTGALEETTIKHVWYYKGVEKATVELSVRSISWRTYSSKNIPEYWAGNWEVKILDADGNELASVTFTVGETTNESVES